MAKRGEGKSIKVWRIMRRIYRRLVRMLLNRNTLIIMLLVVQLVALALVVMFLSQHYLPVYMVLLALDVVLVIYIMNTSENPSYKLPWMIAMMVIPVFAGLAYLLVKTDVGHRVFKRNYEKKVKSTRKCLPQDHQTAGDLYRLDPACSGLAAYLNDFGGYPVYRNRQAEFYPIGEKMFEAMKEEIRKAKRYIFVEFFIISMGHMWDELLDLLKERAQDGVDVRILYDGFGTQFMMPKKYFSDLEEIGIRCKVFNAFKPLLSSSQNNRDHRKIVVIDGHTAFTGGINVADEYINRKRRFGHWKDGGMLLKGEAAWSFTVMFLQLWEMEQEGDGSIGDFAPVKWNGASYDGFIQPYSDAPVDGESVGRNVYLDIINNAREYVYIMTPYLIPDHEIITALTLAAKKGVDVRLMTPHIPDKWYAYRTAWSYYPELLEGRVRIFEYEPGFVHAKNVSSDDKIGQIGTINLDYRSFYLQFECACVMYGSDIVKDIRKDFEKTLNKCIEIHLEDCQQLSIGKRIIGWLLRIFAPLL